MDLDLTRVIFCGFPTFPSLSKSAHSKVRKKKENMTMKEMMMEKLKKKKSSKLPHNRPPPPPKKKKTRIHSNHSAHIEKLSVFIVCIKIWNQEGAFVSILTSRIKVILCLCSPKCLNKEVFQTKKAITCK